MTEERWLDGAAAKAMLRFVKGRLSERKLRLMAVAVSREYKRLEPRFDDAAGRQANELAEELAEGGSRVADPLRYAHGGAFVLNPSGFGAASRLVGIPDVSEQFKCDLLRCVAGNPFCPVAFAPAWRSETVVSLAAGIYEERAFDRLPILADALEEAGCDHPDVLSHSRGPSPHARGCWVVDGVLGKE